MLQRGWPLMPEHHLTPAERCDKLSHLAGMLEVACIRASLIEAEAPMSLKKFRSFEKSLEGAIRHAQSMRSREERAFRAELAKDLTNAERKVPR